jgi:hypothetical protein
VSRELPRLGPKVRAFLDLGSAVVGELDLARVGIDPVTVKATALLLPLAA